MTTLNLTKLREIAVKATPGDWGFERAGESHCAEPQCCSEYWDNRIWADGMVIAESHCLPDEDAHHIATFDPPTVLALLDEIGHLKATLDNVRSDHARDWASYIEGWEASAGVTSPTVRSIVQALRGPTPFGWVAGDGGDSDE